VVNQVRSFDTPSALLHRVTGCHALSQVVVVPIVLFLFLNTFVGGWFSSDEDPVGPFASVAVASLSAWFVFSSLGALVNWVFPTISHARSVAVLLVFALTEVVRISVVFEYSEIENSANDLGLLFRITSAAATGLVLFGLASIAVGDYLSYREVYRSYIERLSRLSSALRETQSHVAMARTQLAMGIRQLLSDNVAQAFDPDSPAHGQPEDIAKELFRISDEVVRPLSHGLSEGRREAPRIDVPRDAPRISPRVFADDVTSVSPFQPIPLILIVGLMTAPSLLVLDLRGSGLWAVFMVTVALSSFFGQRFLRPVLVRLPVIIRIAVITPLFSLPWVFLILTVVSPRLTGVEDVSHLVLYGAALGALLGWLPAIAEGLQESRARFVAQLESVDHQLSWWQVRAQSQLWLDQKRLALALHSDVQSAILSAAMHLRSAVADSPEQAALTVKHVRESIMHSLELGHEGWQPRHVDDVVANINANWSSLITLSVLADPGVIHAIESDRLALEVVTEVVKELHLNSFKHGRATECTVELSLASDDTVLLSMRNNGAPLVSHDGAPVGLGDSFLQSVSITAEAINDAHGVRIDMTIPLTPGETMASRTFGQSRPSAWDKA
jgi:signal transduction histidine kinase